MISIPAVGVTGPQRSGTPKPNTQYAKIVEGDEHVTDPSDSAGSEIQSGIADEPAVTKTGNSNSPVKAEIDAVEASPLQMTLVAALQSTISAAHSVAMSNGDSARALIAEAVDQIEKIQASFVAGESDIERKLRELREASTADDDEDDDPKDDEESDDPDKKPKEEDGGEMRDVSQDVIDFAETPAVVERAKDDKDDEEDDEDEDEHRSLTVSDALREIRREKGVPQINSVSEGLAYLRQGR